MLNIGCGDVYLDGWINIDFKSENADLNHDLRKPLPYGDNSVDFIYNEHFIEHLSVKDAVIVLRDFYRVLKKGGVLRTATLDLDYLVSKFTYDWKNQDWITTYGFEWIETRAEMLNICLREWGHKYVYNSEELERRLREAGFNNYHSEKLNNSSFHELSKKETRKDSKLILEAVK